MKELEEYAMINKIPIMQKDGILYLINYMDVYMTTYFSSIVNI